MLFQKNKKVGLRARIAQEVGEAILEYIAERDKYEDILVIQDRTVNYIKMCWITDIVFKKNMFRKNNITIKCCSPGWLIGSYGSLIKKIQKKLDKSEDKDISNSKILIAEEKELPYLTSILAPIKHWEDL